MRCPSCSTENAPGAAFCQHCGTALNAPPPTPPQGGYTDVPQAGYTQVPQGAAPTGGATYVPVQAGLSDNVAAAIAYLTFIPALVLLVLEPYSRRPFVRFHAFQCLGLTVASLVLHFAIGAMSVVLHVFGFLLSAVVSLVFFVLWLICIVNAAQGKSYKVPVIGDFAARQANR